MKPAKPKANITGPVLGPQQIVTNTRLRIHDYEYE